MLAAQYLEYFLPRVKMICPTLLGKARKWPHTRRAAFNETVEFLHGLFRVMLKLAQKKSR